MIKPEELKDKNFKIYLGMPMYSGMVSEASVLIVTGKQLH